MVISIALPFPAAINPPQHLLYIWDEIWAVTSKELYHKWKSEQLSPAT